MLLCGCYGVLSGSYVAMQLLRGSYVAMWLLWCSELFLCCYVVATVF